MRTPRHSRVIAALFAAGIAAAALTGCTAGPLQDIVGQQAEEAIEGATGNDVNLGGGELPTGFPGEVPLVDGEISFSAGSGGAEGWIVTIDPQAADAVAAATAALEAGGFLPEAAFEGVDLGAKIFSNGTYLVLLSGDDQGVMYTVTPVAQ
ncbi:hypothetical protein [Agromyces silvae]|uniref:hypothetical protein n=1 Tax=Agromyces silvae TaxID=3388266 RepID=UPI00280A6A5F|nr:hypothetical protein [Agromyces protaetiae]